MLQNNGIFIPAIKAPLATEDEDLENEAAEVKVVHLRPQRAHNQRRCQSEVTPSKTAELLVRFIVVATNSAK